LEGSERRCDHDVFVLSPGVFSSSQADCAPDRARVIISREHWYLDRTEARAWESPKRADVQAVVRRRQRRCRRRRLSLLFPSLLPPPSPSPAQTFLILVATADLRALLYTRCFSARRCLWSAFCLANTTTEPRAVGVADAPLLGESRAVPLTDEVDASDGFLRAGAGVDTARPEKALASMVQKGRGGEGKEESKETRLCSKFAREGKRERVKQRESL